jgi:hypothetical protein
MKHFLAKTILAAGAVVLVVVSVTPAHAKCMGGVGSVVIAGTSSVTTMSTTFVDVPKAAVDVTDGSRRCIFVDFSAETYAPANEVISVQLLLDGVTVLQPGPITWVASEGSPVHSAISFQFFLVNVPSGPHTVKVQWRSQNGTEIKFTNRTLIVNRPG